MAEPVVETAPSGVTGDAVVENITEAINGTSAGTKIPATPEGMFLAYASLIFMALLPIYYGSFRSVQSHKDQKDEALKTGEAPETMSRKDAAMFPVIASCALFGLYVFFQVFSKENINFLLSMYFFILGIAALTHMLTPTVSKILSPYIEPTDFHLIFTQGKGSEKKDLINFEFTTHDVIMCIFSTLVGIWYLLQKHWIANNLFGIAFAVNGVELLHLNNIVTGMILLGGLFLYDVFWVFGTNVMVTVAKSFEAPIKLVFPQDLLENGLAAKNMAMLGLGDIVIPGIFIALLLRYDSSLRRGSNFYFWTTFVAYLAGLLITIGVMHVFKHAQPALLYLVPACIGTPTFMALIRGDVSSMFSYADHPEEEEDSDTQSKSEKKKKK